MADRDDIKSDAGFAKLTKIALAYGSNPSKEELLNILHWVRQILALILGVVAGVNHLTGFAIIIGFFVINLAVVHFYANKYIQIDEEKIEQQELYTEALGLSFAVFLVSWTITHSYL